MLRYIIVTLYESTCCGVMISVIDLGFDPG